MAELALIEWHRLLYPPVPAIVFGALAGVAITAVVGYFLQRVGEIGLKERMVEKGYSASEIERVVLAASPGRGPTHTPPQADGAAYAHKS